MYVSWPRDYCGTGCVRYSPSAEDKATPTRPYLLPRKDTWLQPRHDAPLDLHLGGGFVLQPRRHWELVSQGGREREHAVGLGNDLVGRFPGVVVVDEPGLICSDRTHHIGCPVFDRGLKVWVGKEGMAKHSWIYKNMPTTLKFQGGYINND